MKDSEIGNIDNSLGPHWNAESVMVPDLLIKVINEEMWREFYDEVERDVLHHSSFESFVTTEPPEGLGTDVRMIQNMCRDHRDVLDEIDKVTQGVTGVNNINTSRPEGTSAAYALRKLRKDAPEVHAKVIAGDISPNAGMIKAGFRKKTMQCPVEVEAVVRAIRSHFTEQEIEKIGTFLVDSATR